MIGSGHNRLLKILHIDPEKNWGGGEAQVLGLLTYLAKKGHRNDLLTHPLGQLFRRSQGIDIRRLPLVVRNDLDLRRVAALRRRIKIENYDVVHLHTKRAHSLALWLPRGAGAPKYVVTRRMDYPEPRTWYTKLLYNRRVDGVIAISRPIAELLKAAGVRPERVRVIHSGIDPRQFEGTGDRAAAPVNDVVVGMMAVMETRKGHRYLFEAARLLQAQGLRAKYLIAGDGSLRDELRQTVEQLGVHDSVEFLGFVSDAADFLSKIDIFVMPSLYEGLGVAVLEAMATGKPVIATRVGGLAEVVIDGVTGLLVPARDGSELARAIDRLARDNNLARVMGQGGAQRVREEFTIDKMAERNEACYYSLLNQSS